MTQILSLRVLFKLINFFVVLKWLTVYVNAECNVCSASSGLACVSGNQFQVCVGNSPTGNINICPSGTVCSSVGNRICQEPGPNTIEACHDCNKCDPTNTFACTGPSTYVLCLGAATPSELAGSCQPNHVCNRNNQFICEEITAGGVATCPNPEIPTSPPTTKATPTQNPIHFCRTTKQNGRFPVGLDTEPTCRHYFYCFLRGGTWSGQLYKCPAETYFNSASRLCELGAPEGCE